MAEKKIQGTVDTTKVPAQEPSITDTFPDELHKGIRPTSKWDLWWEQTDNNFQDGTFGAVAYHLDNYYRQRFYKGPRLTADEANKLYPDMPEPFQTDIDPFMAKRAYDNHMRRKEFQSWLNRGPEVGLPFHLTSGFASALVDPIEIALNSATMGVFGSGRKAVSAARVVGENLAQNVATEALVRSRFAGENDPLSLEQSAVNIAAGTAAGTTLHYGAKALGFTARKALEKTERYINGKPPGAIVHKLRKMIVGVETGKKVASIEASGPIPGPVPRDVNIDTGPIAHPGESAFYSPIHGETQTPVRITDDYGGITVIDNSTHARNSAQGAGDLDNGYVRQVDFNRDAKFLSLDTPSSDSVVKTLLTKLKSAGHEIEIPENATLRDVLNAIKDDAPDALPTANEIMKSEGIAGYTDYIDTPSGKSNAVHIIDDSAASVGDPMQIDPDKLAKTSPEELQRLQQEMDDPTNDRYYDPPPPQQTAFVTPEGKKIEPAEFEAYKAEAFLQGEAKSDPLAKELLEEVDLHFKRDESAEIATADAIVQASVGDPATLHDRLKETLATKGIDASEDDVKAIAQSISKIREKNPDINQFNAVVSEYIKSDVEGWKYKRKQERLLNGKIRIEAFRIINKLDEVRTDVVENLLDFLNGNGRKPGYGFNNSTDTAAAGVEGRMLRRMRQVTQKYWHIIDDGLLHDEITMELGNLQMGGKESISKSADAFEIAKIYHMLQEEDFAMKSSISPMLEKIQNYFLKQTHDREKIKAVDKYDWVEAAYQAFGDKSFPDLDDESARKVLETIYDEIVTGKFGHSAFDRAAGETNLAFKIAHKRRLIPKDAKAFADYNKVFGKNIHVTMADVIRSTARDTAVALKFGTTPKQNVDWLLTKLKKIHPTKATKIDSLSEKIMDIMHQQLFMRDIEAHSVTARSIESAQKWTTGAINGFTFLRSMQDFASATSRASDSFGGSYLGTFSELAVNFIKNFGKSSKDLAEAAFEFGALPEGALRNLYLELGATPGNGKLDKMLQVHAKVTLAERGRAAMTATAAEYFARDLARGAKTEWKNLDPHMRQTFLRYGIKESDHAMLKHGIVKAPNGQEYLSPDGLMKMFLKMAKGGDERIVGQMPEILEKVPRVLDDASQSEYQRPGNPYYMKRDITPAPRDGFKGYGGADLSDVGPYNIDSSAKVGTKVHDIFKQGGFTDAEASVAGTLYSTFFDSIGKHSKSDPKELFDAYYLKALKANKDMGSDLGYLQMFTKSSPQTLLVTRGSALFDKTILHESGHFFLEVLQDVKNLEKIDNTFKGEIEGLFKYLGAKEGQITMAGHELFVNTLETFMRTGKAPTTKLEKLFATIRDWYRRAFVLYRKGADGIAMSLTSAHKAPEHIESFYKKLLGGEGQAELFGPLTYKPETMGEDLLYGVMNPAEQAIRLPLEAVNLVTKIGTIINDSVLAATTSPGAAEKAFMYGRTDKNTLRGAIGRAFWQFKSSTVKAFDTVARSYYSNPYRPQGDIMKPMKFALLSMGLYTMQRQAQNLFEGKTLEDPTTPEFALKALGSSGAGSVLADTLINEITMATSTKDLAFGFARSLVPAVTNVGETASAGLIALKAMMDDDTDFPSKDLSRKFVSNIPFQNVFYAKALLHFYLLNAIREESSSGFLSALESRTREKPGLLEENQDFFMLRPTDSPNWIREIYQ